MRSGSNRDIKRRKREWGIRNIGVEDLAIAKSKIVYL